jgi:hypothetical protein
MAKLETQISQIFLNPTDSKKLSLILFEEKLSANTHLFLLAELRNVQKRTELNDLSKISEMIIETFKANKKMPGEALFENTLAQINNNLAEMAHKGRKSWLGKFSALIALRSDSDFHIANSGYTSAWLKRRNNLTEILGPDKAKTHPLKTFLNFSSGRLAEGDNVVLASSSIFNYISVELFSKILNTPDLSEACGKVTEILKSSARPEEGFAVFMLNLSRKPAAVTAPGQVEAERELPAAIQAKAGKTPIKVASPAPAMPIYAPMPEDMEAEESLAVERPSLPSLNSLTKFSVPKFSLKIPKFSFNFSRFPGKAKFLPGISGPGKFFLASFALFAILFAMNITAFGVRKAQSKQLEKFNTISETFVNFLADAESSLLYKNMSQAMKLMSSAEGELAKLRQLNAEKAKAFESKFEEMNNKVNRVTVLRNLTPVFEMPYPVTMLARAGNGYLISNDNPNSLSVYAAGAVKNMFMLNSVDGQIRGLTHVSGMGNFVGVKDKIYFANESTKEFEQVEYASNGDLTALKFADPNRVYTLNKNTNQVMRFTAANKDLSSPTNLLKTTVNLKDAQDMEVNGDIFILFPDTVTKFNSSGQAVNFQLGTVSEPLRQMTKIRVGNQVYLLEPISNRVLIYSRAGELLNQVHFPELNDLQDLYVDEAQREMYLLNGSKVFKITF